MNSRQFCLSIGLIVSSGLLTSCLQRLNPDNWDCHFSYPDLRLSEYSARIGDTVKVMGSWQKSSSKKCPTVDKLVVMNGQHILAESTDDSLSYNWKLTAGQQGVESQEHVAIVYIKLLVGPYNDHPTVVYGKAVQLRIRPAL
jgi:hypothetical protein